MATFNQSEGNHDDDDEDDPLDLPDEDAERHTKCIRVIQHAILKVKRKLPDAPNMFTKSNVSKQTVKNKVHCKTLCMNPISSSFYENSQKGIALYEPFGGMCEGLRWLFDVTFQCIDIVVVISILLLDHWLLLDYRPCIQASHHCSQLLLSNMLLYFHRTLKMLTVKVYLK
jgi:hypothetical protein